MPELRLFAVSPDGTQLVLKATNGSEYTLPIDERLRAALRGDRARLGQIEIETESHLRPREIQARIRAGATAEEVAQAAGAPLERVRRFEGPVLAERAYMAQRAQAASMRHRGDQPGPKLGDIVSERLKQRGVNLEEAVSWDAWRREDNHWVIQVTWQTGTRDAYARWRFDPPRRLLSALDDEAQLLSSDEPVDPRPAYPFTPRLATVRPRGAAGVEEDAAEGEQLPQAAASPGAAAARRRD
ncbi:MAG: septation protein SepH, partial [Streptomycetales bacterium]